MAAVGRLVTERYRVPRERITVIPTGVPADRFPPVDAARRAAARAAFGLDDERPIVLYLGWLSPEKGPQVAIDALRKVPDATLVVAGDGPQRAELERQAADVTPDRVRFLGAVDDVSAVMSACDVFVLPASIEGLPAVLIEAGLTGLPVVATDIGAVREVILHEETGIVVPPEEPDQPSPPPCSWRCVTGLVSPPTFARIASTTSRSTSSLAAWDALLSGLPRQR